MQTNIHAISEEVTRVVVMELAKLQPFKSLPVALDDILRLAVQKGLVQYGLHWAEGNQVKAARRIGMNRNTVRKVMKQTGLKPQDFYMTWRHEGYGPVWK